MPVTIASALSDLNPIAWVQFIISDALPHTFLLPFAIILGTLILEDLTTILVGILASSHAVDAFVALVSLYAGIILGDCALYGLGALARTHPFIAQLVYHKNVQGVRDRLERNLRQAVVSTRFIPGLRLPTYVACGFFRMPFGQFAESAIIATLIWTTGLFGISYLFGYVTESWLPIWRWPIAIASAIAIFLIGRYRSRRVPHEDKRAD